MSGEIIENTSVSTDSGQCRFVVYYVLLIELNGYRSGIEVATSDKTRNTTRTLELWKVTAKALVYTINIPRNGPFYLLPYSYFN